MRDNIKMKGSIVDNLRRTLKFTVGHVYYFVVYLEMTRYVIRHEKLCTEELHLHGLFRKASHPDM